MRQRMSKPFGPISIGIAALALALLATLWPGAALAKDHPQISLSPNNGVVNTQITIAGKNFPAFCAGVIFIDDTPTNSVYGCDNNGSFQAQITWQDGLDDGKHTISARGAFSSAQVTFTQITATPTPNASATAAVNATATAGVGQATATAGAVQSTATASAPTATTTTSGAAAGAGGGTTTPTGSGLSPAMMGMILVASLLLIAGGILLALALSNRRQATHSLPAPAYRPMPPPPPPSDATLPQGEQWIWPNDPQRR